MTTHTPITTDRPNVFDTFKSEFRKFFTVRSTYITGIVTLTLLVGLGILFCLAINSHWNEASLSDKLTFNPAGTSLGGIIFAQLAVGVLGALIVTAEFSSGAIQTTLTATPKRFRLLVAKAGVLKVVVLVIGEVGALLAFLLGQQLLTNPTIPHDTLGSPGVALAIFLTGVYLVLAALLGMGIGILLRHTAGAISTYVGIMLVLPILTAFLPGTWRDNVSKYLPYTLGGDMTSSNSQWRSSGFGPWAAAGILTLYVVGLWALAAWNFNRRDV